MKCAETAPLVSEVTAGPGGAMTDEVGVITGDLTIATIARSDGHCGSRVGDWKRSITPPRQSPTLLVEGDENQTVPDGQSGTDGSHGQCIGGGVHVDRFQQANLVTLRVDDFVLAPLADIG